MKCTGLHCPGCKEGGGAILIIVLVGLYMILTSTVHSANHWINQHIIWLEGIAVTVAILATAAVIFGTVKTIQAIKANTEARRKLTRTIEDRPTVIELPAPGEPPAIEKAWPDLSPYYPEARKGEAER